MADFLSGIAGSLFGGLLGYAGQSEANSANAEIAQRQMDFQERMSNTAYQRQVKDMESAGLNPMLAYVKGGGASSPAGASYEYRSPAQAGVSAYESASRSSNIQAQTRTETKRPAQVEASTGLDTARTGQTEAETEVARAKLPQIEAETIRIRADTMLKQVETDLRRVSADQARMQINLMENQVREINARIGQIAAATTREQAQARNLDASTIKLVEETKNLPFVQRQLAAAAAELTARLPLLAAQAATETERKDVMFWTAVKVMRESSILDYDIEAIVDAGNFRRQFGQYENGLDMLLKVANILNSVRGSGGGAAPSSARRAR